MVEDFENEKIIIYMTDVSTRTNTLLKKGAIYWLI